MSKRTLHKNTQIHKSAYPGVLLIPKIVKVYSHNSTKFKIHSVTGTNTTILSPLPFYSKSFAMLNHSVVTALTDAQQ